MADVKFTVEGKGKNLKKTAQEAGDIGKNVDKSNAALDRAGGKQDAYNRREKGIFQTNLSSGKAYSKLAQNIGGGGSSSLVGAYATLAANVFALSAAFHALRDAAQFEQLVEGLNAVGDAAGRNLGHLGERLKEITDNAISAERAMRAVAVGTSAGFSAVQLEKLTTVAKGASIALGRDMGDAMDRLVRGAAKLEPEILDELGIMVRLDEATENYAAQIGKTAGALTQFERRMAFVTAINEQGLQKFESIAESVDPVPYDQLAASLNNLGKAFLGLVNGALRPFIDLLASSQTALVGATALFASTITRQMLPALHNMAGNARQAAHQFAEMNPVITKNIVTTGKLPAAYKKIGKSIKDGTASIEEMAEGQEILNRSQAWYQNMVNKGEEHPDYEKNKKGLENVTKAAKENEKVLKGRLGTLARIQSADALTMAQFGSLRDGWAKLNQGIKNNTLDIDANIEAEGRSITMKDKAGKAAFKYGQRIKFVGASVINALPWLGLLATAVGVITQLWDKFNPGDKLKEATDEAMKSFSRLDDINAKLLRNMAKTNDAVLQMKFQYQALGGVLNTVVDVVGEVGQAVFQLQNDQLKKLVDEIIRTEDTLEGMMKDNSKRFGQDSGIGGMLIQMFGGGSLEGQGEIDLLPGAKKAANDANNALKDFRKTYGTIQAEAIPVMEAALSAAIVQADSFIKRTGGLGQAILQKLGAITFEVGDSIAGKQIEMQQAISSINSYNDAVNTAAQLTGEFVKQRAKLFAVDTTPFDDLEDTLDSMADSFNATNEMAEHSRKTISDITGIYTESIPEAQERLNNNLIEELKLRDILGISTRAEFEQFRKDFKERNDAMRKHKGDLEALKSVEKETAKIRKASFFSQVEGLKMARVATKERMKAEQTDLENQRDQMDSTIQHIGKRITAEQAIRDDVNKSKEERKAAETKVLELQAQQRKNRRKQTELETQIVSKIHDQNDALTFAAELNLAILKDKNTMLKLEEDMFKLLEKSSNLEITRMKNAAQMANLRDPARRRTGTTELDPAQEYQLLLKTNSIKQKMINDEYVLAVKRIKLDHELLKAKTQMQKAESEQWMMRYISENADRPKAIEAAIQINEAFQNAADVYITGMGPLLQERLRVAKLERDVSLETLGVEKAKAQLKSQKFASGGGAFAQGSGSAALGGGGTSVAGDFVAGMRTHMQARTLEEEAKARAKGEADYANKFGFDADTLAKMDPIHRKQAEGAIAGAGDAAVSAMGPVGLFSEDTGLTERMGVITQMTSGMIEQLKQLGPEGELAAAIGQGMQSMTTSISVFADTMESDTASKADRAAAGLATVANVIGQTAAIMAASSRAKIAGIDKEIAAEKKRDGKSKESLAKIKQLEQKKDQMARKAFERNKKMQIAGAIASTAAGVAGALGSKPWGPWNFALAAIVGAMGLAQIAVISGTSYEGGGTAGSKVSPPSQINMGERNNRVDISGGRANAAGEMAYLRGARGSGTSAADFRPAFAGRKYRAAGGAAYVVGEQGPELFVPSVPGRVVSNDDMETATPSNVNFTINAIDAAGVEEVLVEQRGNIIGMLRESANEYGTGFLEEVNEDAYTSTTEGSVYGRA